MFPGRTTSTTYLPGWASNAVTGTVSTSLAVAVVRYTVTAAWSSVPAAAGWRSVTCTGMVVVGVPSAPCAVVATVPTEETTPGVEVPFGSVMLTASPARRSDCWDASRGIVTTCRSAVAVSTAFAGAAVPDAGLIPDAGSPRLRSQAALAPRAGGEAAR